jgi:biotin transport system substrate-specific component
MKTKKKVFDMCLISVFVAVIAAMAQLTIPFPVVPLTMQTFAVPLAGAVLGAKKGAIAVGVYVLLGATGVPVFQSMTGGLGIIAGNTGGFILSFPLFAFITGVFADSGKRLWLGLIIGAVVMFLMGGIVFPVLVIGATPQSAFLGWVAPFLIGDLLKITMVFAVAPKIRNALERVKNRV